MAIKPKWYADPSALKQHWRTGTVTYLIALSIIALLSLFSHYLVQSIVQKQEATARVVNQAGRQRMLSQRITRFAGEMLLPIERQSTPQLRQEYLAAIDNMAEVHQALVNGSVRLQIPIPDSIAIQQLFHQNPINLNKQVTDFITTAKQLADTQLSQETRQNALIQLRFAANRNLLDSLDKLVSQYQYESEQAVYKLQNYNRLSLFGMLLTLLLEALFIFRPLLLNLFRREQQYHQLLAEMESEISDRIHFIAFHDPLTELPNRLSLLERVKTAIQSVEQNQSHLVVISIGLDRFKDINNSLGHDQGDDLLVAIANRLDATAHKHNGVAARIAGDEFVLFLNNKVKTLDLMRILRQLKLSIIQPLELNKRDVQIGASLGIAVFPEDGVQAEELLLHANQAMRVAKTDGGNAFRFFQPTMTVNMARKMKLEQELRLAIISNQLELHYQPKIRLTTGEITGVEALIRWHHPDEGMLSPAEFIPIAEDSGLIVDLGDWVLVEALRQASIWHKQQIMIDIAINVSVKQLLRRNVSDRICALSEQMAINTHYIQLEITENNMMENLPRIIDQLEQLRNSGFVIAIDDFGTGHSSLASLRDLPINVLKIDRSFVTQAMEDDKDAQIVRAIIEMGHSLNKQIIAEGIETTEQMYLLQNFNCDEGQGYLFSKPVSARLITPLLEQHMIQISATQAPRQHGTNML
nr:EAL domain-containing protein [uncultured Tolumonas sp.]